MKKIQLAEKENFIQIEKDDITIQISFSDDTVSIDMIHNGKIIDTVNLPRTNQIIYFLTKETGYRENTIRKYIYDRYRETLLKKEIISFDTGKLSILNIKELLKFLSLSDKKED